MDQNELHGMLKGYRQSKKFNNSDWALYLLDFFSSHPDMTIETYKQNCFQLIEVLTDINSDKLVPHPKEHIRMLARLLDLLGGLEREMPRLFSYIDDGSMEAGYMSKELLAPIADRWNTLYNTQK
jgi:hypothetical protein